LQIDYCAKNAQAAPLRVVGGHELQRQTAKAVELANRLALDTECQDLREQGLRRWLKNPLLQAGLWIGPWLRDVARIDRRALARHLFFLTIAMILGSVSRFSA
jgi:hypothetical protein